MADSEHPRPNFFVIGAEKAGTTSLCELLSQHPDVFFSSPKEPNFFTRPVGEWKPPDWYDNLFAASTGFTAVGEGSTTYSKCGTYPGTAERIAGYAPNARIIYIVRRPLERLESQWIQRRHMALPTATAFDDAIKSDPILLDAALYWKNISAYRDWFPDSRIQVLFLDDLRRDPSGTLASCFRFLGVSDHTVLDDPSRPRNTAREKRHDGTLLSLARQIPGYENIRDSLLPASLRMRFKQLLTRPIADRPQWSDETRRWMISRIRDDNLQFLEFYGRPPDEWPELTTSTLDRAA